MILLKNFPLGFKQQSLSHSLSTFMNIYPVIIIWNDQI